MRVVRLASPHLAKALLHCSVAEGLALMISETLTSHSTCIFAVTRTTPHGGTLRHRALAVCTRLLWLLAIGKEGG